MVKANFQTRTDEIKDWAGRLRSAKTADDRRKLVNAMSDKYLGHAGNWEHMLMADPQELAQLFINGAEANQYRKQKINDWFQQYLGRPADEATMDKMVQEDTAFDILEKGIRESPEAQAYTPGEPDPDPTLDEEEEEIVTEIETETEEKKDELKPDYTEIDEKIDIELAKYPGLEYTWTDFREDMKIYQGRGMTLDESYRAVMDKEFGTALKDWNEKNPEEPEQTSAWQTNLDLLKSSYGQAGKAIQAMYDRNVKTQIESGIDEDTARERAIQMTMAEIPDSYQTYFQGEDQVWNPETGMYGAGELSYNQDTGALEWVAKATETPGEDEPVIDDPVIDEPPPTNEEDDPAGPGAKVEPDITVTPTYDFEKTDIMRDIEEKLRASIETKPVFDPAYVSQWADTINEMNAPFQEKAVSRLTDQMNYLSPYSIGSSEHTGEIREMIREQEANNMAIAMSMGEKEYERQRSDYDRAMSKLNDMEMFYDNANRYQSEQEVNDHWNYLNRKWTMDDDEASKAYADDIYKRNRLDDTADTTQARSWYLDDQGTMRADKIKDEFRRRGWALEDAQTEKDWYQEIADTYNADGNDWFKSLVDPILTGASYGVGGALGGAGYEAIKKLIGF